VIGIINFYGKFIPKRAEILEPITRLTGKQYNVQHDWGKNQDRFLDMVKKIMSTESVAIGRSVTTTHNTMRCLEKWNRRGAPAKRKWGKPSHNVCQQEVTT